MYPPLSYGSAYPAAPAPVTAASLNFAQPQVQSFAPVSSPAVVPMPAPSQTVIDPLAASLGQVPGIAPVNAPGYANAGQPVAPMGQFGKLWNGIGGMQGLSSLLEGLGGLGQVYTSLKGLGLAKDQLSAQNRFAQANLENQTQSYNTALEGRIRAQYHSEGRSAKDVDKYLAKHSL